MEQTSLLAVPEIAARLQVTEETVRTWLRQGDMRGYNLGGRSGWRVPPPEVERFLARKVGQRPVPPEENS